MHYLKIITSILLFSAFASCNWGSKQNEEIIYIKKQNIVKEKIQLSGLTCVGCEITVEEKLAKIEGVVASKADYYTDEVFVEFDSTKTNLSELIELLRDTAYKPK
jgi:copper chaperone